MQHITGTDRQQVSIQSLEQQISQDKPVRVMDAFAEKPDSNTFFGFVVHHDCLQKTRFRVIPAVVMGYKR